MIRGTTPTFTFSVNGDVDLTQARDVYVTIHQPSGSIELTGEDLAVQAQVVECYLSQELSLGLAEGKADVQINWTYLDVDGVTVRRDATKVKTIQIEKQLLKRVI